MARLRKKKNLLPRLESCAKYTVASPEGQRGRWAELSGGRPVCLEIGSGKGGFACAMAEAFPGRFFLALEREKNALVMGMERAMRAGLENLLFLPADASALPSIFAEGEAAEIYLNFSDPWPGRRHEKRRLTHRAFLAVYKGLLAPGGGIFFKTDNEELFDFTLKELGETGFRVENVTRDLHSLGGFNVKTEYEERFSAMGMPIHRLEAFPE